MTLPASPVTIPKIEPPQGWMPRTFGIVFPECLEKLYSTNAFAPNDERKNE